MLKYILPLLVACNFSMAQVRVGGPFPRLVEVQPLGNGSSSSSGSSCSIHATNVAYVNLLLGNDSTAVVGDPCLPFYNIPNAFTALANHTNGMVYLTPDEVYSITNQANISGTNTLYAYGATVISKGEVTAYAPQANSSFTILGGIHRAEGSNDHIMQASSPTNLFFQDAMFYGPRDIMGGSVKSNVRITAWNCGWYGTYDLFLVSGLSTPQNIVYTFNNCDFISTNNAPTDDQINRCVRIQFQGGDSSKSNYVIFNNCRLVATTTNASPTQATAIESGGLGGVNWVINGGSLKSTAVGGVTTNVWLRVNSTLVVQGNPFRGGIFSSDGTGGYRVFDVAPTNTPTAGMIPLAVNAEGETVWSNLVAAVTNSQARIGPGTNNFIAKFNVVGGTNVGNSPLYSADTNYVWQRQAAATGATYTNSATNAIFAIETSDANTNARLEFVSGNPFNNEVSHIRNITAFANQRAPIYINDAIAFEPNNNPLSGHSAGFVYPLVAATYSLGTGSLPFLDVWASRIHAVTGLSSGPQFGTGVGGTGFGMTTDNTMLQFFRDTGITAAFNKERSSGTLQLDLAGNLLGFGTGISNCIAWLQNSSANGIISMGTNNSGSAPIAVGFRGANASGTDKPAPDSAYDGGASTGTGLPGAVRLRTVEAATSTSSSVNTSFKDRVYISPEVQTLTESTDTTVCNVALAASKFLGLRFTGTMNADDGTDFQTDTQTIYISAVNKAGTVFVAYTSGLEAGTGSAGTFTVSWTAVANGNSVDIKCNAVSSLTQTTLKARWRLELDGDGTLAVTP